MLDKLEFLNKYNLENDFIASKYDWETIEEIVSDFESRQETLKKSLDELLKVFANSELPICTLSYSVERMHCRASGKNHF
jgi:hypothetical protein